MNLEPSIGCIIVVRLLLINPVQVIEYLYKKFSGYQYLGINTFP